MISTSRKYLGVIYFLFLGVCLQAQAAEPCAQIPKGLKLESQQTSGPLCADVLLKSDEDGTRKLRVFEAGKLAFETEEAALCKTCGGTLGDPFQGIKWSGQTLVVDNEGGSRESSGETWKFAKRDTGWVIIGWERTVTDRLSLSTWSESVNALTGKAIVEYQPGEHECENFPEHCKKGAKPKGEKLACSIATKSPPPSQLGKLRELAFACGLKMP